jgi:hypothetical protein
VWQARHFDFFAIKPCDASFTTSRDPPHTSTTSTSLVQRDSRGGEPLLQEECMALVPSTKQPQQTSNMARLCVGDANQISNSNPQHFFFVLFCIPLSFLRVCTLAKSTTTQTGKPGCVVALRGYPIRLASKILHQFLLLFKDKWDSWTQLCLDSSNNLFHVNRMVHT